MKIEAKFYSEKNKIYFLNGTELNTKNKKINRDSFDFIILIIFIINYSDNSTIILFSLNSSLSILYIIS